MSKIHYMIVEHDGGWTYRLGDVMAETFVTHAEALAAATDAAARQHQGGETVPISWQDESGAWHEERSDGGDRPDADVIDG